MRFKLIFINVMTFILFLVYCAVPPPTERIKPLVKTPTLRIGLAERLESLEFAAKGGLRIFSTEKLLGQTSSWDTNWRVEISSAEPAQIVYQLQYKEVFDYGEAMKHYHTLKRLDLPVIIKKMKKKRFYKKNLLQMISYSVLLKPEFDSEQEAYQFQWEIRDKVSCVALPFLKTVPSGKIKLQNMNSGKIIEVFDYLRLEGDLFTLNLNSASGFHFETDEPRSYAGELEFIIDRFGKLTVMNKLSFEEYLQGVVGAEMQEKFPMEALKAQAVTARSYSLARIGKQHRLSPFDLCDEVHCHVYGGIDKHSLNVTQAVKQTKGMVLMSNDQICETYYAGVCGGHTENNENVWAGEPKPYLKGALDAKVGTLPNNFFSEKKNVRLWIESSPKVFCNTQKAPVPDYLQYTVKYFRWQVSYTQAELSRIIRKKTAENIGQLLEIIPVHRGVSGRLIEIKLRGSRETITIEKELAIRKVLSENYLYSSCFVVDRKGNNFIIKGAGWGHGVGMCQTGAAMMALQGYSFKDILMHYYKYTRIVRLY